MKLPLVDLATEARTLRGELLPAITRTLRKADFILGEEVTLFEEDFARFCKTRFAVSVANGTDALTIALLSCGIAAGDEVITTASTFVGTVSAIARIGAIPVLVDIRPDTYTLDVSQLKRRIRKKTRAIIPVHLYGQSAEMGPLLQIGRSYGLKVIDDACQDHGST